MELTRGQLRALIIEASTMDKIAKLAGDFSDQLSIELELLWDLTKLAGKTAASHMSCMVKHGLPAGVPESLDEALDSLEAYGLCVLEGSELEDLRAKWKNKINEKRQGSQEPVAIQGESSVKITKSELQSIIQEELVQEGWLQDKAKPHLASVERSLAEWLVSNSASIAASVTPDVPLVGDMLDHAVAGSISDNSAAMASCIMKLVTPDVLAAASQQDLGPDDVGTA